MRCKCKQRRPGVQTGDGLDVAPLPEAGYRFAPSTSPLANPLPCSWNSGAESRVLDQSPVSLLECKLVGTAYPCPQSAPGHSDIPGCLSAMGLQANSQLMPCPQRFLPPTQAFHTQGSRLQSRNGQLTLSLGAGGPSTASLKRPLIPMVFMALHFLKTVVKYQKQRLPF